MIMTTTVYMASAIWSPAVAIGAEHFGVSELVSTLGITTFGMSTPETMTRLQLTHSGRLWSRSIIPVTNIRSPFHRSNSTLHYLPTPVLRPSTPNSRSQPYRPIPRSPIPSRFRRKSTTSNWRSDFGRYLLSKQITLRHGYLWSCVIGCSCSGASDFSFRSSRNWRLDMAILGNVLCLSFHFDIVVVLITGNIQRHNLTA